MATKSAKSRLIIFLSVLLLFTLKLVSATNKEFQWRHQFVGAPKYVFQYSDSIIVGTEQNVVASLNLDNGSIKWRNLLPNSCILDNLVIFEPENKLNDYAIKATCLKSSKSHVWNGKNGLLLTKSALQKVLISDKYSSKPATLPLDVTNTSSQIISSFHPENDNIQNIAQLNNYHLVIGKDNEVSLFEKSKLLWSRQEYLASTDAAEFIHLPLSEDEAQIAFDSSIKSGLFGSFFNRLHNQYRQVCQMINKVPQQISDFFSIILGLKKSSDIHSDIHRSRYLHRDRFGLRKLIILVSRNGVVSGVDTFTGLVLWTIHNERLSTSINAKVIVKVIEESDYADESRAVLIHPNGFLLEINPILGEIVKAGQFDPIKQISSTMFDTVTKTRSLIILDINNDVHIYPPESSPDIIKSMLEKQFTFVIQRNSSHEELIGYQYAILPNKIKVIQTWTLPIDQNEYIVDTGVKSVDEVVHSPARLLGDRDVLYKYVNPNLIAILTQSKQSSCNQDPYLNIYLIDGVRGELVHWIHHPKSKAIAQLVHSENWLVYSYYNLKNRRTEVSSLEMYTEEPSLNSVFSSFTKETSKPSSVEHKSFIFPGGIDLMTATVTLRAMTNRHIIAALPSGALLEIPRIFLDPRRPVDVQMIHREEGLIPYMPILPLPSESIINDNHTLIGMRKIITSPAYLESTSLVFQYGIDLFFTRVTPSKTFDILKDDFDHMFISIVLFALVVGSYVTKMLARRKALYAAWA